MGYSNGKLVGGLDLSQNQTSPTLSKGSARVGSMQLNTLSGSTAVGVFKLQASNDGSTWADVIALGGGTLSVAVPSGAGANILDFEGVNAKYVRGVYTATSGTGTGEVWYTTTKGG